MNFILIHSRDEHPVREPSDERLRVFLKDYRRFALDYRTVLYAAETHLGRCHFAGDAIACYLQGYVRNTELPVSAPLADHMRDASAAMAGDGWPLADAFTGSFGGVVWNGRDREITLANDVIGFYPVYYLSTDAVLAVSSSLLALGALFDRDVDPIGLATRVVGPEYTTFGRRTIVDGVKRLLPGELLRFAHGSPEVAHRAFDNTLYQGIRDESLADAASRVWEVVTREVDLALRYDSGVAMGMSGGLDSRILLGAIGREKAIRCMTYGDEDYYETKLSKRCAEARGAAFSYHPIAPSHFPSRERFREYVLSTEATGLMVWLSILDAQDPSDDGELPMMLGDVCEAIPGRNIKAFASREARIKNFLPSLAGRPLPFTPNTPERFEAWKQKQFARLEHELGAVDVERFGLTRSQLVDAARADLGELLDRVDAHRLESAELFDELLAWYVHGRISMCKQYLVLKSRFFPISPMTSMGVYRAVSRVRPSYRLNSFLMDKIFATERGLADLRRIPIAQVPFVSYGSNNYLKLVLWGLRSKTDQLLISRAVRRRDPSARSRVLKSIDWCEIYRREGALDTVASWFERDHTGRREHVLDLVAKRARLEAWPLNTFDVASIATANMEVSILEELRGAESPSSTFVAPVGARFTS